MLGAVVGLGGGVIIRPILDAIGFHGVLDIAFLTSSSILVMAVVSTAKKVKDGTKIEFKTAAFISVGALVGGVIGNLYLEHLVRFFDAESTVQMIQAILNIIVLALAIYFTSSDRFRYRLKSPVLYPFLGVILGVSAIILGISGGPVNVPVFMVLFSMPAKQATAYSIVIVFFSHSFRLVTMAFTEGLAAFDISYLLFIIPAAVAGGILGSLISKRLSDNTVTKAFNLTMAGLILLNLFNSVVFL